MDPKSRYPLSWPAGWKRTTPAGRRRGAFGKRPRAGMPFVRLTLADGLWRLQRELDRLGGSEVLLSTNVVLRLDGLPRSGQPEPADPGAAVYFKLKGQARCLACDRWLSVADNVAGIAAHIEALRAIERYGVGTMDQAFRGYVSLPPADVDWRIVLGLEGEIVTETDVVIRHASLARKHHPDLGGDAAEMAKINRARDLAITELRGR